PPRAEPQISAPLDLSRLYLVALGVFRMRELLKDSRLGKSSADCKCKKADVASLDVPVRLVTCLRRCDGPEPLIVIHFLLPRREKLSSPAWEPTADPSGPWRHGLVVSHFSSRLAIVRPPSLAAVARRASPARESSCVIELVRRRDACRPVAGGATTRDLVARIRG